MSTSTTTKKPKLHSIPDDLIVRVTIFNPENPQSSVEGWGLIDTGASTSCIAQSVVMKLGTLAVGQKGVRVRSGRDGLITRQVYRASIVMTRLPDLSHPKIALLDPTLDDMRIQALIGHDILKQFKFCLDGRNGQTLVIE